MSNAARGIFFAMSLIQGGNMSKHDAGNDYQKRRGGQPTGAESMKNTAGNVPGDREGDGGTTEKVFRDQQKSKKK